MEIDVLDFRLLFGVEPRDQEIHRSHVLHNQWILAIKLRVWIEFGEDVFTHLDDVFRLDERTIFQAAYNEQEDIFSQGLHLDSIDIDSSNFEETPHIFEDINKNKSKLIQCFLDASLIIHQLSHPTHTARHLLIPLLQLRLIGRADLHDPLQLVDL